MAKVTVAVMFVVLAVAADRFIAQKNRVDLYVNLLKGWGLPGDLYKRQAQLKILGLSSPVNRVDWIGEGVEEVTLNGTRIESLKGLPSSLRSLRIQSSQVSDISGLPLALKSLQVEEIKGPFDPAKLPASLGSLALSTESLRGPQGLPSNLRSLTLEAPLDTLEGLPRSLRELRLIGARINDLRGLPPTVESLTLQSTSIVSLAGLPSDLTNLTLSENSPFLLRPLPKQLMSLSLGLDKHGAGERSLTESLFSFSLLPRFLQSLYVVSVPRSAVWANVPSLKNLWISDFDPYATTLPNRLRELAIGLPPEGMRWLSRAQWPAGLTTLRLLWPGSDAPVSFERLNLDLPLLEELDCSIAVRDLEPHSLSPSLKRLHIRLSRDEPGLNLPPTLELLDLGGSDISKIPKLPLHLRELKLDRTRIASLSGLTAEIVTLDISGTHIRRLRELPAHLRKLTLSVGQVESLEGLPASVRELYFVGGSAGGASGSF